MGKNVLRDTAGLARRTAAIVVAVVVIVAAVGAYFVVTPALVPAGKNKIGLVTDIGGRGDLSFNDMGFLGADKAAKDLGYQLIEVVSVTEADYLPNLRKLAQRGDAALIVAVGFLLTDATVQVSKEFPNQNFAIIDGFIPDRPNVLSVLYREHEGSAMVGAVAAMLAAHYKAPNVGMALGIEIPVLWKFEIGYKFGVDWALKWYQQKFGTKAPVIGDTPPKQRVLWTYTGTFSDPVKGYEAAKVQFAQGAVAVYNVGGPIGLGIFQAAEELGKARGRTQGPPFGIGVDADQDWIRPGWIIVSMMKRVDVGVFTAAKLVKDGKFKGGILELGPKDGGIAVSKLEDMDTFLPLAGAGRLPADRNTIVSRVKAMRDAQPSFVWEAATEIEKLIKADPNFVPLAFTADEIKKYRDIYG